MDLESRLYATAIVVLLAFVLFRRYARGAARRTPWVADEAWASGALEQLDNSEVEVEHCLQEMPEEELEVAEAPGFGWMDALPTPPPSPVDAKDFALPPRKKNGRRRCTNRSGCAVAVALQARAKLGGIPSVRDANRQVVEKLCCDILAKYNVRACDVVHVVPLATVLVFSPTGTDIMAKRLASTREVGDRLRQHRARYGRSTLRKILDWLEGEEHLPSLEFGQH